MNALAFLVRRQIANFFRSLTHHPSKLVVYLLCIAGLVFALIAPGQHPPKTASYSDIRILGAIYLGILIFFGFSNLLHSLKSGTMMFSMSEVNFLFVSPISPKKILNYGLMKATAATLFGFIFLLFYSGILMEHFRIQASGVFFLLGGLVVMLIIVRVLSLLIYSLTNGRPERQRTVRISLFLYFGAMLAVTLYLFQKNGGTATAFYRAAASPALEYFPVIGWAKGAAFALIGGNSSMAFLYSALLVCSFFVSLVAFQHTDTDYYEDVLQGAETDFELRQSIKQGKRTVPTARKRKVGRTGIGHGWGADTFFYKHLCETRRRSRFLFISVSTVFMLLGDLIFLCILHSSQQTMPPDQLLLIVFAMDLYFLFLTNGRGDWSRELAQPYIYLIPASPSKKLMWASMTSILKPAVDGVLFFTVIGIVLHVNPLTALACCLVYASFGLLFLAGNVLSMRTIGSMSNRGFAAILYMLALLLLMAPGAAGSFAVYFFFQGRMGFAGYLIAGLPMMFWNILVSAAILYCCRNILSNVEITK